VILPFAEGATAARRDVLDGRVYSAAPHRVLHDTGDELLLAYWPGITSLAPQTWIDALNGDRSARGRAISDLAAGRWTLPDLSGWRWKDEDEYAQARRIGVIDAAEAAQIEAARERAVTLIESRGGPLAGEWPSWQADPAWPLPTL
jgi:hypothetical protein